MKRRCSFCAFITAAVIAFFCAGAASAQQKIYDFEIVNTYPHDPQAFTQGLFFLDGFLYESTGLKGLSSIRKTDIATGDRELTLEAGEGANWQPGDTLLWQLGSLPYDRPETINWGFAQVKAVNGDVC